MSLPFVMDPRAEDPRKYSKWTVEIMRKAQEEAKVLYEEQAAKDATYREIYTSYRKFLELEYRWFSVAELGFGQFAFPGV